MIFWENLKKKYPIYSLFFDTITMRNIVSNKYSTRKIAENIESKMFFEGRKKEYNVTDMLYRIDKNLHDDFLKEVENFLTMISNEDKIRFNFKDDFMRGEMGIYLKDYDTALECYNKMLKEYIKAYNADNMSISNMERHLKRYLLFEDSDIDARLLYPSKVYYNLLQSFITKGGSVVPNSTIYLPFEQIEWY